MDYITIIKKLIKQKAMKKIIYKVASLLVLLSTIPSFAQPLDPGDDPVPAPIGDYVWILAAIGFVYVFFKLSAFAKQTNIES